MTFELVHILIPNSRVSAISGKPCNSGKFQGMSTDMQRMLKRPFGVPIHSGVFV